MSDSTSSSADASADLSSEAKPDASPAHKRVLITGASGFIGRRLRTALLADGVDVVAIRRGGSPAAKEGRSVSGDYADVAGLTRIIEEEKPDAIYHVAGVTKGRSYADFEAGNVMPTQHLLQACAHHKDLSRFVLVSSLAAFGPSSRSRPLEESDPRRPVEYYGQSKRAAEELVENSEVPWTIVRPSGVYGPGDVDYFELFNLANRRVNLFFGNRDRAFSAIYVDDCVDAILTAGKRDEAVGNGYFLTDDAPTTWGDFQDMVVRAVGKRALTLNLPELLVTASAHLGELATRFDGKARLMNRQKAKMSQQDAWLCSGEKAKAELGFEASVDQAVGVERTHKWYRDQGWYS